MVWAGYSFICWGCSVSVWFPKLDMLNLLPGWILHFTKRLRLRGALPIHCHFAMHLIRNSQKSFPLSGSRFREIKRSPKLRSVVISSRKLGRPPERKQIQEDIRRLYELRWFFSVEPEYHYADQGILLIYKVIERPMVTRVEFRGNHKIRTKHLAALTGLKKGSPFDISANLECVRRIENAYHTRGYYFAKVKLLKGKEQTEREVIFEIIEGPKVKVTSIRFQGNRAISTPILKTKLKSKAAFLRLLGGMYDPDNITNDVNSLKMYYRSLGYFDATIERDVEFSPDKSSVTLTFRVQEGARYRVRNINLIGNQILTEQDLRNRFTLKPGDLFNARHLTKDIDLMKTRYGEQGRLYADVKASPTYLGKEYPGLVDLTYEIDESKPLRIRSVNVHFAGDHPKHEIPLSLTE